jgi:hypothetical protein
LNRRHVLIDLPDGYPGAPSQDRSDTRTYPDFFPHVHGLVRGPVFREIPPAKLPILNYAEKTSKVSAHTPQDGLAVSPSEIV